MPLSTSAANRAAGVTPKPQLANIHGKCVDNHQAAAKCARQGKQALNCFNRLHAAHHTDQGRQHATVGAAQIIPAFVIQAAIAGAIGLTKIINAKLPFSANGRAGNKRHTGAIAGLVHRKPCRQIVAGIHNNIDRTHRHVERFTLESLRIFVHRDIRVQLGNALRRRGHFVTTDISSGMRNLTLQITELNRIAIGKVQLTHTCSGQIHRHGRPQATHANNQYATGEQFLLPRRIDFWQ